MSTMTDDELAVALARSAVERAAPEELVIFPAASEAFLEGDDPSKKTRGDPMLGFGVESAVILLSPVALKVAKDVLGFLRDQLKKQADEHGDEAFDWLVQEAAPPRRRQEGRARPPRLRRHPRSSPTSSSTRCASSRSRRRSSSSSRRTRRSSSPTRSSAASRRRERASPASSASPLGARLSPFVFPSDTTFRFLLLLVAVVGANLYIWNWLWLAARHRPGRPGERGRGSRCTSEHQSALSSADRLSRPATMQRDAPSACLQDGEHVARVLDGRRDAACSSPWRASSSCSLPIWIRRRRRLRPLRREDAPAVVDELGALARESGMSEKSRAGSGTRSTRRRPVSLSVAPGSTPLLSWGASSPVSSPIRRRSGPLSATSSHICATATSTSRTRPSSLWYAFLLVSVLPFAVVVADEGLGTILSLSWRMLALALLVYLTRNAVLRAREVYADVRASVPDGEQGALRRILGGLPETTGARLATALARAPGPVGHGSLSVNDPRRLFPVRAARRVRCRSCVDDRAREPRDAPRRLRPRSGGAVHARRRRRSRLSRWARSESESGGPTGARSPRAPRSSSDVAPRSRLRWRPADRPGAGPPAHRAPRRR